MKYRVAVDDNFHYMDASERTEHGTYESAAEALAAAKEIVDRCLRHIYRKGFTPEALYKHYVDFGEDPFIISDDKSCTFSAWEYAKQRCPEVCAEMANQHGS